MLEETDFIFEDISSNLIDVDEVLSSIEVPTRIANILRRRKYHSMDSFYNDLYSLLSLYQSQLLFPNRFMAFYPQVKERHASKELTCNLSGAKIKKGSIYYTYHPFIEDIQNGRCYTISKEIKTTLDYIDLFPQDLSTYEDWYYKVKNAYYNSNSNEKIDFYSLSIECGDTCLEPKLLGISKNRRI